MLAEKLIGYYCHVELVCITKQNKILESLAYPKCQTFQMVCNIMLTAYGENPLWFNMQNHLMINIPLLINQHGILLNQKS